MYVCLYFGCSRIDVEKRTETPVKTIDKRNEWDWMGDRKLAARRLVMYGVKCVLIVIDAIARWPSFDVLCDDDELFSLLDMQRQQCCTWSWTKENAKKRHGTKGRMGSTELPAWWTVKQIFIYLDQVRTTIFYTVFAGQLKNGLCAVEHMQMAWSQWILRKYRR